MKAGLSLIMNTKIKACIFDIDDTLFDMKTKTFIPSALKALKQLEENGIKIILATGRPPQTAKAIREYDIQPDYTVCTNGHIILDKDGSILMQKTFSFDLVQDVYDYCIRNGLGLLWKYPDLTYEYIHADVFENFYNKTKDSRKKVVFDDQKQHYKRLPNGGCIASSVKQASAFNANFAKRCVAIKIDELSSDLMLYGVNKLSGVKEVLDKEGILFEECAGFGDNNNDIEILSKVGVSVAVGSCSDQLREKVDMVTADINDDGIYKALLKLGLI